MALNSLDIQNKTFNTKMRGFAKNEVDEFLDLIIRDYDEFSEKIKDQERELKTLREQVKYFDEMKDSLNKSIVVAQDAADNLKTQSQSEANSIIAEAGQKGQTIIESAKKEASTILENASDDARQLIRNTDELKRKMRNYHQKLAGLIENQVKNIHSAEWEEVLEPIDPKLINPEEKLQEIVDTELSGTSLIQKPLVQATVELKGITAGVEEQIANNKKDLEHSTVEKAAEHSEEKTEEFPELTSETPKEETKD